MFPGEKKNQNRIFVNISNDCERMKAITVQFQQKVVELNGKSSRKAETTFIF